MGAFARGVASRLDFVGWAAYLARIKDENNTPSAAAPARFIPDALDGVRLDKAVKLHFELSWIKARAWIETGKVFVEGNAVQDQALRVAAGQRIELRMGVAKAAVARKPRSGGLDPNDVVYFDDSLIVVNKRPGVMTVPHPQSEETATLDRLALDYLRENDRGARSNRASLGVVHRIDKETSGLVVFARTAEALQSLTSQFREHSIERRYYAIVHGSLSSQRVESRLLRDSTGDGLRGSAEPGAKNKAGELLGRVAITHVEKLEALPGSTYVACRLETGRTHQIRIHLSELGCPIIGEKVYVRGYRGELIKANRVMLHAAELGFLHPSTGERVSWSQRLPNDFAKALKRLRKSIDAAEDGAQLAD